jgi:thiamine pyrophosphokinase
MVREGICFVVSAGDLSPDFLPDKKEGDLLVAADAGYKVLSGAMIEPDLFVGDGDSLGFIPELKDKTVLPCVKDDTDTHAAIKIGFERGFTRFVIYGALGGARFSHSIANLRCLSFIAKRGGEGIIADERCTVRLIAEGKTFRFCGTDGYFSLFPLGEDAEVTVSGAKYEVVRAQVPFASTLGASNEPRGECSVTVHKGEVLFVREPGERDFFD